MGNPAASPPAATTVNDAAPGDAEASPPVAKQAGLFSEPGVVQRVACAAFAWSVTIAPAAFSRAGGWLERATAVVCLAVGIAGPMLMPTRKRWGRQLGITLFLALATVVWLLTSSALDPSRLDTVRAGIGAIAWGVYAFAWGEPWRFRTEAPQDDAGGVLRARTTLPSGAVPVAAIGVLASLGLLILGWSVRDPSRALLAQAASIGLAVAIVSVSAQVAIARAKGRRQVHVGLPREALRAIVALLCVALLGAAALIWRS
jgi:hypothetical protein